MKRVIIYGVDNIELRRNVEYFLDDQYEIIGYTDTYHTSDVIDGKRFVLPTELTGVEFDFIVMAKFSERVQMEIRDSLREQGIPPEKIVSVPIFSGVKAGKGQLDLVTDLETNLMGKLGLIFGLSYSLRGIRKEKLRIPFYDFSWDSLDLYYNYKLFYYALHQGLVQARTALFVLPYYYFDYDMSRSLYQYRDGPIFSVHRLNDWHHYLELPEAREYVENYRMFGEKVQRFYQFSRFQHENASTYAEADGTAELAPIWFKQYEETAAENQEIFRQFLQLLFSRGMDVALVIPPFYLRGLQASSADAFQKKKERFYSILQSCDEAEKLKIFDCSDIFCCRRELFKDLTHLNSAGADVFTEYINTHVLAHDKRIIEDSYF